MLRIFRTAFIVPENCSGFSETKDEMSYGWIRQKSYTSYSDRCENAEHILRFIRVPRTSHRANISTRAGFLSSPFSRADSSSARLPDDFWSLFFSPLSSVPRYLPVVNHARLRLIFTLNREKNVVGAFSKIAFSPLSICIRTPRRICARDRARLQFAPRNFADRRV